MTLTYQALQEIFVDSGAVSQEQFNTLQATKEAKELGLERVLVSRGFLSEKEVGQLMSFWYRVPFVELSKKDIRPQDVVLLPEAFARAHHVLVISQQPERVIVASSTPKDTVLRSSLEKYFRTEVQFQYATEHDLRQHFFLYQEDPDIRIQSILKRSPVPQEQTDTRVIDLIDAIIDMGYQRGVSDIHLEPEEAYLVIRYRQDGLLHDVARIPEAFHERIMARLKVLSRLATDEHRKAQDGKISHKTPWGSDVEIRLSILPTTQKEKAVMRLLSEQAQAYSLVELGLQTGDYQKIADAMEKPWGMILATGPTGCGKTTTLYAMLQVLNRREVNITTIEDPVEVDLEGINQIQVDEKTGLTFAKGLRSIVRQDPDIIMVGEIRDSETASIAINAAMTGHLVLSTLHTNDAATAFVRLLDMGIEPFLLSSTVNVVVAQRLVRKVCMNCIESVTFNGTQKKLLEKTPQIQPLLLRLAQKATVRGLRVFHGKGCKVCHGSGYKGRIGVFETLVVTDEIREAVMTKKHADEIEQIAIREGMDSMLTDGLRKALLGQTTLEEVLRVVYEEVL
ncbi:type II/IV secretion system protein [Candidatus Uhrbacteria bacterium]|nr:type II/IV secretion system protein [Candidatus Uhrbacteria bacterium]